jgi:hypothetical protein
MSEIRLTGLAELTFVGFGRKVPRFFHELIAVSGVILPDAAQHLIQRHRFVGCESHGEPPFKINS